MTAKCLLVAVTTGISTMVLIAAQCSNLSYDHKGRGNNCYFEKDTRFPFSNSKCFLCLSTLTSKCTKQDILTLVFESNIQNSRISRSNKKQANNRKPALTGNHSKSLLRLRHNMAICTLADDIIAYSQ